MPASEAPDPSTNSLGPAEMKLTLNAWIEREFEPDSRPTINTVRRWTREGRIPSTRIGKRLYIDSSVRLNATDNTVARIET
jgi:hypothetical protein